MYRENRSDDRKTEKLTEVWAKKVGFEVLLKSSLHFVTDGPISWDSASQVSEFVYRFQTLASGLDVWLRARFAWQKLVQHYCFRSLNSQTKTITGIWKCVYRVLHSGFPICIEDGLRIRFIFSFESLKASPNMAENITLGVKQALASAYSTQ